MKNIHIIPTDKPSRLYSIDGKHKLANRPMAMDWYMYISSVGYKPHNIYITSDEEINEGDWFYDLDTKYVKIKQSWENSHLNFKGKKIILTTDQGLINEGVQGIDGEFLKWFVKNPICEDVKVVKEGYKKNDMIDETTSYRYKIIIPKEEQKQHLIDMMKSDEELGLYDETEHLLSTQANKERLLEDVKEETQRMYSEEEVIDLLQEMNDYPTIFEGRIDIKEWFEQLKKK
jgi:hypothetical protein